MELTYVGAGGVHRYCTQCTVAVAWIQGRVPPGKNDDGKRLDCAVRHFIIPGGLSRTADNWVAEGNRGFPF